MDGKVLIYVRDYQLKRKVIGAIALSGVPFVEVVEIEELDFKMQLFDNEHKLFIYEYGKEDTQQYERLEKMKEKGWKSLVVFPEYKIEYIDAATKAGVDDLIMLPIEVDGILKKIKLLLSLPTVKDEPVVSEETVNNFDSMVELEINRAQRGKYALSFVLIDASVIPIKERTHFIQVLKNSLRETDVVIPGKEVDHYFGICPFTPKNYLVEVENKVRSVYDLEKAAGRLTGGNKLYVYGLTYIHDGDNFEKLYNKLLDNINQSKILDRSFSKQKVVRNDKTKVYRRAMYQNMLKNF